MQQGNKAVLDTNIVVSAAISVDGTPAQIFESLLEEKFKNYTSEDIVDEIRKVIQRPTLQIDKELQKFIIYNFKSNSILVKPTFDEKITEDPSDNKFINCALTAKANIVSGDNHLLKLREYKGKKKLMKICGYKLLIKNN